MENTAGGPPPMAPPPPRQKSNTWKWVLGGCSVALVLGIVLVVVAVRFFKESFTMDPVKVERLAHEMIDFEAPEGVHGAFAMKLGLHIAMLMPDDGFGGDGLAITVMTFPSSAGKDTDEMRRKMQEQLEMQGQGGKVEEKLAPETFTVRGEEVTAGVQIARQATGDHVRQYFLVLEGKPKPVLLMLMGNVEGVTHETVQAFLDTVK